MVVHPDLKGSGSVARTMPSQLRAGVPPLRPQLSVGAAPPNKKTSFDVKYEEKVRNNKQNIKCLKKATFDVCSN